MSGFSKVLYQNVIWGVKMQKRGFRDRLHISGEALQNALNICITTDLMLVIMVLPFMRESTEG